MISREKFIEWVGSLSGLGGAAIISSASSLSNLGFFAYLLSNFCWLWYGYKNKAWSLVAMQVGFTLTTVMGIYNKGFSTLMSLAS